MYHVVFWVPPMRLLNLTPSPPTFGSAKLWLVNLPPCKVLAGLTKGNQWGGGSSQPKTHTFGQARKSCSTIFNSIIQAAALLTNSSRMGFCPGKVVVVCGLFLGGVPKQKSASEAATWKKNLSLFAILSQMIFRCKFFVANVRGFLLDKFECQKN